MVVDISRKSPKTCVVCSVYVYRVHRVSSLQTVFLSRSFTGCVAISGPATSENIHLTWVAFEPSDVSGVGLTRAENIPMWTTGTKCVDVHTGETVRVYTKST